MPSDLSLVVTIAGYLSEEQMGCAGENVVDLIEAQADLHPDRLAVVSRTGEATYAELVSRMRSISAWLVEQEIGPEIPVAVCADRSLAWVTASLGVLHSGGVYVPVNPMSPLARRASILKESSIRLLLVEPHVLAPSIPSLRVETLDAYRPTAQPRSKRPGVSPAQAAYGVYTSGSTGRPKYTVITHESLSHYATMLRRELAIDLQDRYLHIASIEFSAAIRQLVAPLVCGATIVIGTKEEIRDPARLAACMLRSSVTVFDTVPSYLRSWIASVSQLPRDWREGLAASLRLVLTTGEPLSNTHSRSLSAIFPSARLVNLYGQTETTGTVALTEVRPASPSPIPIGQAVEGCRFYVLNERLEPSLEGEVFIAGSCLARGYQSSPSITASHFLPDPFSGVRGGRMYKTGDHVRRSGDGTLEFKGRADNQVKFHGIRIDLTEIEAALLEHPGVEETAVVLRETTPEHSLIAAFVVFRPGSNCNPENDLRAFLSDTLGEALIPALIVAVDALPRTLNGKLDRPSLRSMDLSPSRRKPSSTSPRTRMEELVAKCWEDVLGLSGIGDDDDFFALGGDSIQAIDMIVRMQKLLQLPLPLGAFFFRDPTLDAFAGAIQEAADSEQVTPISTKSLEG